MWPQNLILTSALVGYSSMLAAPATIPTSQYISQYDNKTIKEIYNYFTFKYSIENQCCLQFVLFWFTKL